MDEQWRCTCRREEDELGEGRDDDEGWMDGWRKGWEEQDYLGPHTQSLRMMMVADGI
jgi:hypothetical protein